MRVLMLTWEYPPNVVGGLGKHVGELAPALARCNLEAHVVVPSFGHVQKEETVGGATVHRVVSPAGTCSDFYVRAFNTNLALQGASEQIVAREGPFDLIHCHDWLTFFAARELKLAYKLPLLATIHATERGRGRGYLHSEQSYRIDHLLGQLNYEAWRIIS